MTKLCRDKNHDNLRRKLQTMRAISSSASSLPFVAILYLLIFTSSVLGFGTYNHLAEKKSVSSGIQTGFKICVHRQSNWEQLCSMLNNRQQVLMKCHSINHEAFHRLDHLSYGKNQNDESMSASSMLTSSASKRIGYLTSMSMFIHKKSVRTFLPSTQLFMDTNVETSSSETSTIIPTESSVKSANNITFIISNNKPITKSISFGLNDTKNGVNGHILKDNGDHTSDETPSISSETDQVVPVDHPMPTVNGGYSHTATSKAKISQANKGKTPWNKGRKRSAEDKARISAGVRAKNRERLLKKIAAMGMTEDEYNAKIEQEKKEVAIQKAARRTAKGGYIPTDETKAKISRILQEKYKNGEIKKRKKQSTKGVLKSRKHSEETRKKISESLKARWNGDENYKANIKKKIKESNSSEEVRDRISSTLKKKWQDPEFRAYMMEKMAKRKKPTDMIRDEEYRKKISESMKKKWEDPKYRARAINGMASSNKRNIPTSSKRSTTKSGSSGSTQKKKKKKKVGTSTRVKATATISAVPEAPLKDASDVKKISKTPATSSGVKKKRKKKKKKKKKTTTKIPDVKSSEDTAKADEASVSKMKDERRDLYDLLYGEEEQSSKNDSAKQNTDHDTAYETNDYSNFFEDDEDDFNIDDFDPYGLDELEQRRD